MTVILIEVAVILFLLILRYALRNKIRLFRGGYVVRRDSYMQDASMKILVEDTKFFKNKERDNRSIRVDGSNLVYSRIPLDPENKVLMVYSYCAPLLAMVKGSGVGVSRTLVLGGGGGAVPLYILQSYEKATCDIVEFNADSIRTCKEYFLKDYVGADARANLIHDDAKAAVKTLQAPYQFIFCDLYVGGQPADLVYDVAFMGEVSRLAGQEGMLVINGGSLTMDGVHRVLVSLLASFEKAWAMMLNEGFVLMAANKEFPALDGLIAQGGVIGVYPSTIDQEQLLEEVKQVKAK